MFTDVFSSSRSTSAGSIPLAAPVVGSMLVVALVASVIAFIGSSVAVVPVGAQTSTPELTRVVSCLAGNGRVDSTIVNTTATSATYRVEFEGLSPRSASVAPGDWIRLPLTGRADGDYLVRTLRDGQVISAETVTVECDDSPTTTGNEVTPIVACRDGDGYVLVQLVNNTDTPKPYVVKFDNLRNRSTTAAPYGASIKSITGRPDGTYSLTVISGPETVATLPVTVNCDTPLVAAVANATQCLGDGARLSYVVSNNTSAELTAVLEVDLLGPITGRVAAGSQLTLARRGIADATRNVTVTLGDSVVVDQLVEVRCDAGPLAEPDFAEVGADSDVVIDLFANDDGLGLPLTVTDIDTSGTLGMVELLLADGAVRYTAGANFAELVAGDQLADTFSYTVADSRGRTSTAVVTVTVTGANASPEILGPIEPVIVPENTTAVATATASDADDPAGSLTWSLAGGPDAWLMAIDAATGRLEFLTPPDAEVPLDVGADNTYEVLIAVFDSQGAADSLAVEVIVADVAPNASRRLASQIVDDIFLPFPITNGLEPSMALNADGHPTLSFHNDDSFEASILRCDDPLCEGDTPAAVGLLRDVLGESEIAVGPSGNPTVVSEDLGAVRLLHCNDPACAGFDESMAFPAIDEMEIGFDLGLGLDTDGNPTIAYPSSAFVSPDAGLVVVRCDDPECALGGDVSTTLVVGGANGTGYDPAVAHTSDDRPVVSFYDGDLDAPRLAICATAMCDAGSTVVTLDELGSGGANTSVAVNEFDQPVVAYRAAGSGAVKIATCGDSDCQSWDTTTLAPGEAGASNCCSGQPGFGSVSVVLDSMNHPVVAYFAADGSGSKLVRCNNPTCSAFDPPVVINATGIEGDVALVVPGDDRPIVASFTGRPVFDLVLTRCSTPSCVGDAAAPVIAPQVNLRVDSGAWSTVIATMTTVGDSDLVAWSMTGGGLDFTLNPSTGELYMDGPGVEVFDLVITATSTTGLTDSVNLTVDVRF